MRKLIILTVLLCSIILIAEAQISPTLKIDNFTNFGNQGWETLSGMAFDEDDNYYICGSFTGELVLKGQTAESIGKRDIFIAKMNKQHTVLWLKSYGGVSDDNAYSLLFADNYLYLAGSFKKEIELRTGDLLQVEAFTDVFLAKLNTEGDVQWGKTLKSKSAAQKTILQKCSDGNICIAGSYKKTLTADTTSHEYFYNANGNMITDYNKQIEAIHYNNLNLPVLVDLGNNNKIEYIYDAAGIKLQQRVFKEGNLQKETDYAGNFIYENGSLKFIITDDGRLLTKEDASGYEYVYYIKDHLGNTRVTIAENEGNADIMQEDHYYPFGMQLGGQSWQNPLQIAANKYLYNGKELQDDLGFDLYDYGARMYDPQIGRWNRIDPMIEFHFDYTPYAYVYNNPINFIDPFGLDSVKVVVNETTGEIELEALDEIEEVVVTPDENNDDDNDDNNDDSNEEESEQDSKNPFIQYLRDLDRRIFNRTYKDNWPNITGNSNSKKTRSADAWERWVLKNTDQSELNDFLSYWGNNSADASNANTVYVPYAKGSEPKSVTNPKNKTDANGKSTKTKSKNITVLIALPYTRQPIRGIIIYDTTWIKRTLSVEHLRSLNNKTKSINE